VVVVVVGKGSVGDDVCTTPCLSLTTTTTTSTTTSTTEKAVPVAPPPVRLNMMDGDESAAVNDYCGGSGMAYDTPIRSVVVVVVVVVVVRVRRGEGW